MSGEQAHFDWEAEDICANRHGGNPESVAAHESIKHSKSAQRMAVLNRIKGSQVGMTIDEMAVEMKTVPNAVSGRFTELKRMGRIRKIGRRPTRTGRMAGIYTAQEAAAA